MQKAIVQVICLLLVAILTGCVAQNERFDNERLQWQVVSLGGSKVGHRQVARRVEGDRVYNRETLVLNLRQPGASPRPSKIVMEYVETQAGLPISISKIIESDSANHRMSAVLKDGVLRVSLGGGTEVLSYNAPDDFLLIEGLRLALLARQSTGDSFNYSRWSFSKQGFERFTLQPIDELADMQPADDIYAWGFLRTQGDRASRVYTDGLFYPQLETSLSGGQPLVIKTCSEACALASFNPQTHVYRGLIPAPYKISDEALGGKIRYTLRGAEQLSVPTTPRQRVSATPAGLELVVCDDCGVGETPSEEVLSRALVSNYWLPAAQPEFSALIGRLFLEDDDLSATIKMKRITRFVERHMDEEADYAGYATALEALKSQRGDCTEHALLLAALARAAGIPSRVVIGVAYNNERFLGRRYVFVPHAWVQAWTGERWQSFDSALGEVHSGYIALGVSDGEQEVLLNIHQQLHKLEVMSAVLLKSRR